MLTRKNIIYLAIIGVGLLVLAVDRLAFNHAGPAEVEGAEPSISRDGLSPSAVPANAKPMSGGESITLSRPFPRQLPEWNETITTRDPFAPIVDPRISTAVPDPKAASDETLEASPVKDFANRHRLDGTLVGSSTSVAIINGRRFRVGAELDGFVLLEITPTTVVFAHGDQRVTLSVPRAFEKGPQP